MTFDVGEGVACDLDRLIAGRLLVQASSGQGKTWAIRRLLEQTYGHVQHLVIDPEGEYYTLREKFDYVHAAAKGGDVVAHPRYAAMLATELLKLGASAILDIYELNPQDRKLFVKNFCTALVNAQRELWHPCLIVLDEAHVFCPEKDQAESAEAVKALASRGRKRAFALVLATQRLSKLAKDAAAEMGNKLIGGCRLDIDVKRAVDELGVPNDVDWRQHVRMLKPGEFYASGQAFRLRVDASFAKVTVGKVKTTHPEPGQTAAPTPPATEKVRAVLKRLEALPAEAEEREKSLETLTKENRELQRKYTELSINMPVYKSERVEVPVLTPEIFAQLTQANTTLARVQQDIDAIGKALIESAGSVGRIAMLVLHKVDAGDVARKGGQTTGSVPARLSGSTPPASNTPRKATPLPSVPSGEMAGTQVKILETVTMLHVRGLTPNRTMVARWMAIHPDGRRYRSDLKHLADQGALDLTSWECANPHPHRLGIETGLRGLYAALRANTQKNIVETLCSRQPVTREELAAALGIHPDGRRFRSDLKWLKDMGVIPETGKIILTPGAAA